MPRAYSPRRSTVDLMAAILGLDGISDVRPIAPSRNGRRPTMLRIYSPGFSGDGSPIYSDFTIPDARAFLAGALKDRRAP